MVPELPLPALLQTLLWIRRPMQLLDMCHRRFGEIFAIRVVGFGKVVVLANAEAIKEIFTGDPEVLHAGKAAVVLRPFLGQHSVIVLDGAEHQRQRRLLMPAFHGERMQAYGRTMIDLSDASIDAWPLGERFPLQRRMQGITLQVILRTVFGMEDGARLDNLSRLLARGLEMVTSPLLLFPPFQKDLGAWSPWGRFRRMSEKGDEILFSEIAQRRQQDAGARTDILSMMLAARDEEGRPMSDVEMRDELITLLVAGHETTATALSWAMRFILADPDLLLRLREEIEGALSKDGLEPERVARLELLDATVRETLRMQPIIPLVGRVLQRPMRLMGHDLEAGSVVAPSVYLAHRRSPAYPDGDRFRPERFFGFKPSVAEWLPFGGGARRCLGAAFATYEMKMVLAAVLARTSLRLIGERVRVVRRSITLAPEGGLPVVMTSRRPRMGRPS